jgi:cytochrome P450
MSTTQTSQKTFPFKDPYEWYAVLRRKTPVYRMANGQYMITRYEDAQKLLTHPATSHWGQDAQSQVFMSPTQRHIAQTLYTLSPEADKPYRKQILHQLAARSLRIEEDHIHALSIRLIEDLKKCQTIEFMNDYAHKFTFISIASILGIPPSDVNDLCETARALDGGYINNIDGSSDNAAATEFINYLMSFIVAQRKHPGDGLAGSLVELCKAEQEEDSFILSLLILLFYAGHLNMMNFFGNALLALDRNRNYLAELKARDHVDDADVNELLRYDSPLQFIILYARERIDLNGTKIPGGSQLLVSVGAANRDPERYPDPDRLSPSRSDGHLSFGAGAFRCIGARLALLQGRIGLGNFVHHAANFGIKHELVTWRTTPLVQRGPKILPLTIEWR